VGIPPSVEVVRIEDRQLDLAVLGEGHPLDGPEYSAREDGSDPFGVCGHALTLPRPPCGRKSTSAHLICSLGGQGKVAYCSRAPVSRPENRIADLGLDRPGWPPSRRAASCYGFVVRSVIARYVRGALEPEQPVALREGERVRLIVLRHPDPARWDSSRWAHASGTEDAALAETGLNDWAAALDAEDRR